MKKEIILLSLVATFAPAAQEDTGGADGKEDAEKAVFSGPQKGEKLLPFKVTGVYDDDAGKDLDFVADAAGKPLLMVFVHKLTRPSFGLTRMLTGYCRERRKSGLRSYIVWLQDDRSEAHRYLTRARGSLGIDVPLGISVDGAEGPGAYGLNRNVTLTILIGAKDQVTANFALVQPSDTDAPRILAEVAKLIGEEPPGPDELRKYSRRGGRGEMRGMSGHFRELLREVIRKEASAEEVDKAARAVETFVGDDAERQRELGRIASRVVGSKIYKDGGYGNARAHEHLERWEKEYGPK